MLHFLKAKSVIKKIELYLRNTDSGFVEITVDEAYAKNYIIKYLQDSFSSVQVVYLEDLIKNGIRYLQTCISRADSDYPIVVLRLNTLSISAVGLSNFLSAGRNYISDLPAKFVFLLNSYLATILQERSPDFWSYFSIREDITTPFDNILLYHISADQFYADATRRVFLDKFIYQRYRNIGRLSIYDMQSARDQISVFIHTDILKAINEAEENYNNEIMPLLVSRWQQYLQIANIFLSRRSYLRAYGIYAMLNELTKWHYDGLDNYLSDFSLDALYGLANSLFYLRRYSEAYNLYAVVVMHSQKKTTASYWTSVTGLASLYNDLSICCIRLFQKENARALLENAVSYIGVSGREKAIIEYNYALLCCEMDDIDLAMVTANYTRDLQEELSDNKGTIKTDIIRIYIYIKMGDYDSALELISDIMSLYPTESSDSSEILRIKMELHYFRGIIYFNNGTYYKAIDSISEAVSIAKHIKASARVMATLYILRANIVYAIGNLGKAKTYFIRVKNLYTRSFANDDYKKIANQYISDLQLMLDEAILACE